MQDVTLIGIDLGKHSFRLHGQDRRDRMVFRKKVTRKQLIEFFASFHACAVVMEACAGAHYMARKLATSGHEVKLIAPSLLRSIGPQLVGTLFDGGRRDAALKSTTSQYDGAVADYRRTVLVAFQQVEDNLSALQSLQSEAASQNARRPLPSLH
jgi:hypothetical protein